ncbi:MAG TPA: hypothetical protein RMH99_21010 [Sandaracinaceae bacterium LLY-WYZ-13_1]|nr:hypothetical protein [Sandaracinaceae bacterium LLY-WYZ-13_1]
MSRGERIRTWSFEAVFALVAIGAAVPLWLVEHPPIQDLPQHLAATRVLASYGDPDLAFAQYFEIHLLRTQYLAYYLAAIVLSWPFGPLLANKLLVSLAIVGTPYAMRALLRALGADERVALFVVPLTWNAHLILGFLNFVAAIPLALLGLALAVRLRRRWTRRRAVALAAVTLVCFYTHVVPFAFLGLGAALAGLDHRRWRETGWRWLPLVPAALATLVWTQLAPAGESTLDAAAGGGSRGQAVFVGAMQAVQQLPDWLTDVLHAERDGQLLVAFLIVLFLAAVSGRAGKPARPPTSEPPPPPSIRRRIGVLGPLAAALYFVTPASYDWIWPINARFPLLALVLAIPALPRQRGALGAVTLAAVATIALASSAEIGRAFVAFEEEEVGALDEAIEHMPEGARVAGLVFDRGSRQVKFSPFIHSVAWAQAANGGAVMFTFADFPQSPFTFREDRRPPRVPPRWEWMPERVDPRRDLAWYDYVLVRGGPGRIASPSQPFERVYRSDRWSVWRHVRSER